MTLGIQVKSSTYPQFNEFFLGQCNLNTDRIKELIAKISPLCKEYVDPKGN
ncbi:MAG: hypothetical protein L0207_00625 [Chlamydiae bacterium]|nr:hypothetical protein [Chlamydiota bacterium]